MLLLTEKLAKVWSFFFPYCKAQHALKVPSFYFLKFFFLAGGGGGFFSFFLQRVPFKFPIAPGLVFFFWVLGEVGMGRGRHFLSCDVSNVFPSGPKCFFKTFPIAPQFYQI
jgi:hypothetical protein